MKIDRRLLIKSLGAATVSQMIPGMSSLHAQTADKPKLVIIQMRGGFNALFNSPGAYLGNAFGSATGNTSLLSGGVMLDNTFKAALPESALTKIATIGIKHGAAEHLQAREIAYVHNKQNTALILAGAIGGDKVAPAVNVGNGKYFGPYDSVDGISLQPILDLDLANELLGFKPQENLTREMILAGLRSTMKADSDVYQKNQLSLDQQKKGMNAAISSLSVKQIVRAPILPGIRSTYDFTENSVSDLDFKSQLVAAELMIRGGSNVVTVSQRAKGAIWDTHGDVNGDRERAQMMAMAPDLKKFVERMLNLQGYNVVIVITAEFCRLPKDSAHAGYTTATVIGKKVKNGTTGQITRDGDEYKIQTSFGYPEYWAYIAAALGINPLFGTNKHGLIV